MYCEVTKKTQNSGFVRLYLADNLFEVGRRKWNDCVLAMYVSYNAGTILTSVLNEAFYNLISWSGLFVFN